ncbi:hypothetical protein VIGAN_05213400, partial [Vigna angularis var. angularis]
RETPFLSLISAAILILQSNLLFLPILVHFVGREARSSGSNAIHLHDVWVRSPTSLQRRRSLLVGVFVAVHGIGLGFRLGDLGVPFRIFVFSFFDSTLQRNFVFSLCSVSD